MNTKLHSVLTKTLLGTTLGIATGFLALAGTSSVSFAAAAKPAAKPVTHTVTKAKTKTTTKTTTKAKPSAKHVVKHTTAKPAMKHMRKRHVRRESLTQRRTEWYRNKYGKNWMHHYNPKASVKVMTKKPAHAKAKGTVKKSVHVITKSKVTTKKKK